MYVKPLTHASVLMKIISHFDLVNDHFHNDIAYQKERNRQHDVI